MKRYNYILLTGLALVMAQACGTPVSNNTEATEISNSIDSTTSAADSMIAQLERENDSITLAEQNASGQWRYSETEDKMSNSSTYFAKIDAKELLHFDFPYNGGSTATLSIRNKDGNNDIMLRVSKGQFNSTYDGLNIRLKFDDEPAKTYSASGASSGNSDVIFINSEKSLIAKMKKSKILLIEAEFYDHGKETMEFAISGLEWTH